MTPFKKAGSVGLSREIRSRRCAYNLRLSQVRVRSENAFRRLKGRFQILQDLPYGPERRAAVVKCCACIHNWLNDRFEEEVSDDVWKELAEDGELEDFEEAVEDRVLNGRVDLTNFQVGVAAQDRMVNFLHGIRNYRCE